MFLNKVKIKLETEDKIIWDKMIYLMSKIHRGWSPSPPSLRLMITVFDNIKDS